MQRRLGRNCIDIHMNSWKSQLPNFMLFGWLGYTQILFETTDCLKSLIKAMLVSYRLAGSFTSLSICFEGWEVFMVLESNELLLNLMLCCHNAIGLHKGWWRGNVSQVKEKEGMKDMQESKNRWAFGRWEDDTPSRSLGEPSFGSNCDWAPTDLFS